MSNRLKNTESHTNHVSSSSPLKIARRHMGPASTPCIEAALSRAPSPDRAGRSECQAERSLPRPNKPTQNELNRQTNLETAPIHENDDFLPSMMTVGVGLFICSAALWVFAFCFLIFAPIGQSSVPATTWIEALRTQDHHYKYLFPLQFTLGLVFVIVNWGGLKIFRHS